MGTKYHETGTKYHETGTKTRVTGCKMWIEKKTVLLEINSKSVLSEEYMRLDLSPEIVGKSLRVSTPFQRSFSIVMSLVVLIGAVYYLVEIQDVIISLFLFFGVFLFVLDAIRSYKARIILTDHGFSNGAFSLKETLWEDIDDVIELDTYQGMTTLCLKKKDGKRVDIGLPTKNGKQIILEIKERLEANVYSQNLNVKAFKEYLWPKWGQVSAKVLIFVVAVSVLFFKLTGLPVSLDISADDFLPVLGLLLILGFVYALILCALMAIMTASVQCSTSKLIFSTHFLRLNGKGSTFSWNEIDAVSGVEIGTWLGLPCHSITITSKSGNTKLKVLNPKAFDRLEEIRSIFNDRRNSNGN